jgi:hypothetical protein
MPARKLVTFKLTHYQMSGVVGRAKSSSGDASARREAILLMPSYFAETNRVDKRARDRASPQRFAGRVCPAYGFRNSTSPSSTVGQDRGSLNGAQSWILPCKSVTVTL